MTTEHIPSLQKQAIAIIVDTIREGLAKRTILGMFIVSTIALVIAALLFQMDSVQHGLLAPAGNHMHGRPNSNAMMLSAMPLLNGIWVVISIMLLVPTVCVGAFVGAGFITSMLEKGTIDILLSKPVPRWLYIVGRYAGAVLIVAAEVGYLVLGLYLIAGLSLGTWGPGFLMSIVIIIFSSWCNQF